MKQLKVTVTRDGISMEVEGVKGPACDDIIRKALEDLGCIVETSEEKPEYYEQEESNELRLE